MTTAEVQFKACETCKGTGHLPHFAHVDGGICYTCDGAGEVEHREPEVLPPSPARQASALARLRSLYLAAKSQIRDEGIRPTTWVSVSAGYCPGAVVLGLLDEVPASSRAAAVKAFAELGVTVERCTHARDAWRAQVAARAESERAIDRAQGRG